MAVATALQSAAPDIKVIEDVQVRLAFYSTRVTFAGLTDHDKRLVCGLTLNPVTGICDGRKDPSDGSSTAEMGGHSRQSRTPDCQ